LYKLRVKEVAQEHGLNMTQLSLEVKIDFNTIKALFRDPHRDVRFHTLIRIAEGLNIDLCELFEKEPDN
jgi:DNA-binding Xre family transcriptional regulator